MRIALGSRALVIPLVGALALFIAGSEYFSLQTLDPQDAKGSLARLQASQPWGGFAGQELARGLYSDPAVDPHSAEPILAWQLARSPLNPWRWLDRAELAYEADEDWVRALWHLDAAVAIQPQNRNLRWEASKFAQRTGHNAVAEEQLRAWLQQNPGGTRRALQVASHWIQHPDALVARILPAGEPFLEAALEFARRERRMDMGMTLWARLPRPRSPGDGALLDFVDLALASGHSLLAAEAWAESFPDYGQGQIPNADFAHALHGDRGLNWNTRMPAGTTAIRDREQFLTEPASLLIAFDGRENPRLRRPSLRIPVDPDIRRWALTGYWRGEDLTTRSLPYLHLAATGRTETRTAIPGSTFDWTPFRLEIDMPEEGTVLTLQIRRDAPTREFDRYISGKLWLDALRLEPLDTIPTIHSP